MCVCVCVCVRVRVRAWSVCVCVLLTITGRSTRSPHSIIPTGPDIASIETVSSVTGVGSSHHEGGSRGCVHCSIGGGVQGITVNSCGDIK